MLFVSRLYARISKDNKLYVYFLEFYFYNHIASKQFSDKTYICEDIYYLDLVWRMDLQFFFLATSFVFTRCFYFVHFNIFIFQTFFASICRYLQTLNINIYRNILEIWYTSSLLNTQNDAENLVYKWNIR